MALTPQDDYSALTLLPCAAPMEEALRAKVVGFVQLLRGYGFTAGLQETQDALRVAECFLCFDFEAFHQGLRSLLCLSVQQFERFDDLFGRYWRPRDGTDMISPLQQARVRREAREGQALLQTLGVADEANAAGQTKAISGASGMEVLRRVDFSRVPAEWEQDLNTLAERLWRRMWVRRPSRLRGPQFKRRPNFRRMLRRSLATGGEPMELILVGRSPRRPRLCVLLDVSGSMELYSFFFVRFLHALQQRFRRVSTFLFSTQLQEVTGQLAVRSAQEALERLSLRTVGWNGGTRIGETLQQLVSEHGGRVLRRDTVFVIVSDGLDVGPPEALAEGLRQVRARTHRTIWLNPLLGVEGYEPVARGMSAALPLVDVFASAHNLDSLMDFERHLLL